MSPPPLTLEQWLELDEAEHRYAEAFSAHLTAPSHASFASYAALKLAHMRVNTTALPLMRALIDAARPPCERCAGEGELYEGDYCSECSTIAGRTCPACNGTGKAGT